MEHAVPQNVTSFQFHLVGDMTLKQFGYLAAGMIIAYIAFVSILPQNPLIGLPIIGISALAGVAFAFFPISDRPLDHWVKAYFKAIFSPTLVYWKSPEGTDKQVDTQDLNFKNRLGNYLATLGVSTNPPPRQDQPGQLTRIQPKTTPTAEPPKHQAPEVNQLQQMARYIQQLQAKVAESERQLQQFKASVVPSPQASTPVVPAISPNTPSSTQKPPTSPLTGPQVKVVEPPKATPTQLTLTSSPNVINGIVTDTAGNYLEGAIVSIHDKDGLPVRALKTNKLGQFAGATPLANGIYTTTFEKDSLEFETLQIELNGSVLPPLNVKAKKGGV